MLKKVFIWGAIAFLVFFIAFKPGAAVDVVAALGAACVSIFQGIGDFFAGVAN